MNVVILMAGGSKDFEAIGYSYPKYLLEVCGEPIIHRIIESLSPFNAKLTFVISKEDNDNSFLASTLKILSPGCTIYQVSSVTKGAVCTALYAIDNIDNDEELLIVNGDQLLVNGVEEAVSTFRHEGKDGGVICFNSVHPRWSYVAVDENGDICETSEKRPISNFATVGYYYFRLGSDFVRSAFNIIRKDVNYKGNYYVCSTYNELILEQKKVGMYLVPKENYISFATSQLYQNYQNKKH